MRINWKWRYENPNIPFIVYAIQQPFIILMVTIIIGLLAFARVSSQDYHLTKRESCLSRGLSGEVFQLRWGCRKQHAELRCIEDGTVAPW